MDLYAIEMIKEINQALIDNNGRIGAAAYDIGIDAQTLRRWINQANEQTLDRFGFALFRKTPGKFEYRITVLGVGLLAHYGRFVDGVKSMRGIIGTGGAGLPT